MAVCLFGLKELAGGEHGVGRIIICAAAGWLRYTLHINFRTVESRYPNGFSMEATGDLEGTGIWTFAQEGQFVNVTYDLTIRANKALIRISRFSSNPSSARTITGQ